MLIDPNPNTYARVVVTIGTTKYLIADIKIAGLMYLLILLNFIAIPIEASNNILANGIITEFSWL